MPQPSRYLPDRWEGRKEGRSKARPGSQRGSWPGVTELPKFGNLNQTPAAVAARADSEEPAPEKQEVWEVHSSPKPPNFILAFYLRPKLLAIREWGRLMGRVCLLVCAQSLYWFQLTKFINQARNH